LAPGRDPGVQDTPPERLSRRELEVLTLLSAGATNRAIAQELVLSAETVKSHVANVMRKLRASTRAEAAAKHLHSRASAAERKPP
jgi:DNA-binding NarL/FixJ family response regulator